MPTPDLVQLIREADLQHGLFSPGETVLVGVSGGGDSVALLDGLRQYAPDRGLRLHVGHLDHMLHAGSVDDAAWVARLASEWGVPATLDARNVRQLAADHGRGLEDAARQVRYAFLAGVALKIGATVVATAHHADDQAETVLMNFVRGAGLAGLKGMRPVAPYPLSAAHIALLEDVRPPAPAAWPPRIVRPLLGVRRQTIEAWLAARGIRPRVDPSNADPTFLRNQLRHRLIPQVEAINPLFVEAVTRNAEAIAGELDVIGRAVDEAWSKAATARPDRVRFARPAWDTLQPAIQRRLLKRAVETLSESGRDMGWEQVEATRRAIGTVGASRSLPGGLRLTVEDDGFSLGVVRPQIPPLRLSTEPMTVVVPGITRLPGGWIISTEARAARPSDAQPPRDRWQAWVDADAVGPRLAVRARRPGDQIQPAGLGGRHKSLQDLFVDNHVPQGQRDGWPVVVAGDQVVWVPGVRLDERARVRPDTRRLLVLMAQAPPPAMP